MVECHYRGIKCKFDQENSEIDCYSYIDFLIVEFLMWFDLTVMGLDYIPIEIEDEDE